MALSLEQCYCCLEGPVCENQYYMNVLKVSEHDMSD